MNCIWDFSKYKDKIALLDDKGISLTYENLNKEIMTLYKRINHRCLVFSFCRNEIGSVIGYAAFINSGIVPLMISSQLDDNLLEQLLKIYQPEYLWLPKDQLEKFSKMDVTYEIYDYVLLKTNYKKKYPLFNDLCLLVSTSGSTGSPKLVRQSYENLLDNTKSIVTYLELDDTERPITTLPMNYVYGLSIINSHFFVGATILLTDKDFLKKDFWDFFKSAGATSFGGVPYTYEILDKLRFYRMMLPSLKTMTQAGGKLDPELHEKFATYAKSNKIKFIVMYGASEATARMGYLPSAVSLEKKGAMGIPIPGGKFRLLDENGVEITKPNTMGELIYEGKNVTLGYAERGEDLAKEDERHGILETGDIAQFDENGFYFIVGRKKRFLKIYGNRINLDDIERMIRTKYSIETACSGIDDHMYIFITDAKKIDNVKKFVIEKTKLNHVAFNVIVLTEIPKNEAGKTLYYQLAQYYK